MGGWAQSFRGTSTEGRKTVYSVVVSVAGATTYGFVLVGDGLREGSQLILQMVPETSILNMLE